MTAQGWKQAAQIKPGQRIITSDGDSIVQSANTERTLPRRVIDLSVKPFENYFAGGMLVHNKTIALPPTHEQIAGVWVGNAFGSKYRIQLNADKTGEAAWSFMTNPSTMQTVAKPLIVRSWKLDEFKVTIFLRNEEMAYDFELHGDASQNQLALFYHQPPSGISGQPGIFEREEVWQHMVNEMKNVMSQSQ